MVRPELHKLRRSAAVAPPPERPRFDAIAWKAAHDEDERITEAVAALLQKLEAAAASRNAPAASHKAA